MTEKYSADPIACLERHGIPELVKFLDLAQYAGSIEHSRALGVN